MRRRLRTRDPEAGFTLTEVAVALGVLFIALLALAQTAMVGYRDTALGRQRQTANQIANQLLEEVRGLAYAHVTRGLASEELAGDPNIVTCGAEVYFKVCPPNPAAEPIVQTPGLGLVTPLVPHRGQYGPPRYPNTYDWSVYVTRAVDAPRAGAYRVWAIVRWTSPQRPGVRSSVETQTMIFAPSGCQDLTTHPFGAPCQAYHQGTASIMGGGAGTRGTVQGVNFDAFAVDLLSANATVQQEQISRVDGSVTLPGGRRVVGGSTDEVGRRVTTTQADTDPSTPAIEYQTSSVGPQSSGSLSSGSGTEISVSAAGSDTGSSTSAVAATTSTPCTVQNDGEACAYATGRHQGALVHTVRVPADGGEAALVQVGTSSTPLAAYTRRVVPTPGSDGLVRARVERVISEIRIGGLPERASAPPGWAGYWARLFNYSATVQAEAGVGTTAPSVAVSGTLEYWNGSGYTSVPVTSSARSVTPGLVSRTITGPTFGNGFVSISGTVQVRASSTDQATGSPNTTRSSAEAVAGVPMYAEMRYRVEREGGEVVDLNVVVDLGRALARTSYQPAPTA